MSAFLQACRGEAVDHTPVWFMRQAGRSLPEYRALREGIPMLESCFRTDLVVEITLQPVRRYGVDAAIFFSDIVVPLKAIGVDLDIVAEVVDLAWAISDYLDLQRYWLDHLTIVKAALTAIQAQQKRRKEAAVLNTLGSIYSNLGDYRHDHCVSPAGIRDCT